MNNFTRNCKKEKLIKYSFNIYSSTKAYYKGIIDQIRLYCLLPDKHKTALAISSAICIGVTPLFGFTFILATVFGLVFRLNQLIMQGVHILVSPLQVLLFYPFMQAGKSLLGLKETITINFKNLPQYIYNHPHEFTQHYLQLFLAGTTIWILVSFSVGYCIYSYIRWKLGKA